MDVTAATLPETSVEFPLGSTNNRYMEVYKLHQKCLRPDGERGHVDNGRMPRVLYSDRVIAENKELIRQLVRWITSGNDRDSFLAQAAHRATRARTSRYGNAGRMILDLGHAAGFVHYDLDSLRGAGPNRMPDHIICC